MASLLHLFSSVQFFFFGGRVQRFRTILVITLSLCVLGYELWESQMEVPREKVTPGILLEVLFFGLVFPIVTIVLSQLQLKVVQQGNTIHNLLNLQELERTLANIQDWEQLVLSLVSFPATIAPVSGVVLLVRDPKQEQFHIVAQYGKISNRIFETYTDLTADFAPFCGYAGSTHAGPFACNGECMNKFANKSLEQNLYCLPLHQGTSLIGMLHIFMPDGLMITKEQAKLITYFAPSVVMAINALGHMNEMIGQTRIVEEERRQIARYIHDTLGHNLAYLRLRLDQMAFETDEDGSDLLRQELERLSEVANLAYGQMRMSLADLNAEHPPDLTGALQQRVQIFSNHKNFKTSFTVSGEAKRLSNFIQRRVLLIISELLTNLERHADLSQVDLLMEWGEEEVHISITDDGQAFNPGTTNTLPGHFGLRIIQECTNEIHGHLEYEALPEVGNRVTLSFPLMATLAGEIPAIFVPNRAGLERPSRASVGIHKDVGKPAHE